MKALPAIRKKLCRGESAGEREGGANRYPKERPRRIPEENRRRRRRRGRGSVLLTRGRRSRNGDMSAKDEARSIARSRRQTRDTDRRTEQREKTFVL
jgi:hypothetical protein